MRQKKLTLLLLSLAFHYSQPALACSVCFSAKKETLAAFYFTTFLLTVLPLTMMGFFVIWFIRRTKKSHLSTVENPITS